MKSWNELSMAEKADVMKLAVEGGVYDLDSIRSGYNEYAKGGKIHIDPSKKGTFTAAASKHGMGVQQFASKVLAHPENYSPAMRKKANFARNAAKWKHGDGGNLFDGTSQPTQQMQMGLRVTNDWKPFSLGDVLANAERIEQQKRAIEEAVARRANDYLTTSNDATSVATGRAQNQHLTERAIEGAKAHRAWEEEHPVAAQWGNAIGTVPLAVASIPAIAAGGSGLVALGDAAAATSIGQAITAGLAPIATAASTNIAGAPVYSWADVGLSSLFGAHSAETAIEEGGVSPETALGLLPLTQVAKPAVDMGLQEARAVIDNGTLWDAYTTFGGRLGNYGDNTLTKIYGTAARRFGLPDKARVPADIIRKIKSDVNIKDGLVDFTGTKDFLGNPHVNATIDRPVVSHGSGWDGADTYIAPTKSFLKQTNGSLKSIEPSDVFSNGAKFKENPQNVTLISGDIDALNKAREAGMQTLSSPRLRRLYDEAYSKYKQEGIFGKHPKKEQHWLDYATEVQRLQAQRGTPTLSDIRLLEQQTGLKSGVTSVSEYNNAIKQLESMKNATLQDIMHGKVQPYIYPNGREVDWSNAAQELDLIRRAKYNNIFYDPASYVESNWREINGVR